MGRAKQGVSCGLGSIAGLQLFILFPFSEFIF
jgi:hypothetical protein